MSGSMESGSLFGAISYCGTIDGVFCGDTPHSGVNLRDLPRDAVLHINTRHSRYRLVVLDGAQRLARIVGGDRFDHGAVARINGSRLGESALRVGWIGVGFPVEMSIEGRVLVTSPVRSITMEQEVA
jgi:hypothetical protein